MFKKIAFGLVVAVAALLVVIAVQPNEYHVERTADIDAPPEVVFGLVSDFKQFTRWSPWNKFDPDMKKTYGEQTSGVGGTYEWSGNSKVGAGRMTLTEVSAPDKAVMRLDFTEPMASTATTGFLIAAAGTGSKVTWYVDGENSFIAKGFCLFMDIEKEIGTSYEEGLSSLNTLAKQEVAAQEARALAAAKAARALEAEKAAAEQAAAEGNTQLAAGTE